MIAARSVTIKWGKASLASRLASIASDSFALTTWKPHALAYTARVVAGTPAKPHGILERRTLEAEARALRAHSRRVRQETREAAEHTKALCEQTRAEAALRRRGQAGE